MKLLNTKQTVSSWINYKIISILALLCLAYFPILFIFLLSILMIFEKKFNNIFVFIYVVLYFTLIFYLRQYGSVVISFASGDDAIVYLRLWHIIERQGLVNYLTTSLAEPLYWLFYTIIGYISNYNNNIFIFLNYFIPILLVLYFFKKIFNEKYLLAYLLVTTFAYQYYYALVFSAWRQSLSFPIILFSLYLLADQKKENSLFLMFIAIMTHFSNAFFLGIESLYLAFVLKVKKIYLIIFILLISITVSYLALVYGDLFIHKTDVYAEQGRHISQLNYFIKFFLAFLTSIYIFVKSKKFHDSLLKVLSYISIYGNFYLLLTMNYATLNGRFQLVLVPIFLLTISLYSVTYIIKNKVVYIYIFLLVFLVFIRFTFNNQTITKFLLDGNFNQVLMFSINDFINLLDVKRGFE